MGKGLGSVEGRYPIFYLFYDSEAVATAATGVSFFTNPRSSTKSGSFTNMAASGNFGDVAFDIKGLAIQPAPTNVAAAPADVQALLSTGALTLTVNQKVYFEAPLIFIGGGGGVYGYSNVAASTFASNGFPSASNVLRLDQPIRVQPTELFQAVVAYNAAITLTATTRLYIALYGTAWRRGSQ